MKRISISVLAVLAAGAAAAAFHPTAEAAVQDAHTNLLVRFLAEDGLLLDYVGEIPGPKDCQECRPNAMGWWSPIENGPMFTGPWLWAMSRKAAASGKPEDAKLCGKLANGLVKAASVSDVKGMVVRGFGTDGKCHYPLGSEDQTLPWFMGLHAYVRHGIGDVAHRAMVVEKMKEVADALEANDWACPCDGTFKGQNRGHFKKGLAFRGAAHYLYMLAAMHEVTGEAVWLERYTKARGERHNGKQLTRLQICAEGYVTDILDFPVEPIGMWIYVAAQGCLAELARMEKDAAARESYLAGLRTNARRAMRFIGDYRKYDNSVERPFKYANWRTGYKWELQTTQEIAGRVANSGDKKVLGERKLFERTGMTNPLSCAAVAAFARDEAYRADIEKVLRHYDYSTPAICEFFLAEVAWWAMAVPETP